uniref:Cation-transporting ATPase n=1 Tax=Globodera pallida TaxID=36090 RepID=A0A183C2M7_GLOPA
MNIFVLHIHLLNPFLYSISLHFLNQSTDDECELESNDSFATATGGPSSRPSSSTGRTAGRASRFVPRSLCRRSASRVAEATPLLDLDACSSSSSSSSNCSSSYGTQQQRLCSDGRAQRMSSLPLHQTNPSADSGGGTRPIRPRHLSNSAPDLPDMDDENGMGFGSIGVENRQHHALIQLQDEALNVYGYRRSRIRTCAMVVLSVLTGGVLRLLLHWYPEWLVRVTASKCPLSRCDHVLVRDDHQNVVFRPVHILDAKRCGQKQFMLPGGGGRTLLLANLRFFTYRKLKYLWHPHNQFFATISQLEANAFVLRTAYSTLKGQLVRSIMYPKPVDFRFTKDLFKFVGFLASIAAFGFLYTVLVMYTRGATVWKMIIRSLDIITIVVPPALPAAMSIGTIAAKMRLSAKQIFCTSPSTINTCGAINTICFDKTGTLTEDGLDFNCVRAVHGREFGPEFGNELHDFCTDELPGNGELLKAVATCHSLTRIDKELNGDPLDLVLFRKTGWIMDEPTESAVVDETSMYDMLQPTVIRSPPLHSAMESDVELAVIRQFTFSSSLQRMAVIVHNPNEDSHIHHLYCKGAPEKIASLCVPETVPTDFQSHYMAGYSLTQFVTIMQLYWLNTNLTDFQFLYIDLALVTLVSLSFGYTPACERLARTPPPTRLLSLASMLSVVGQLAIIAFFQVFAFLYTSWQPWFVPYALPVGPEAEDRRSMQGTAVFCVSMFQYIMLAMIYSKGFPYRRPLFSNKPLCISLLTVSVISVIICVQPPAFVIERLEFDPIPYIEDRLLLLTLALLNGVVCYLYENFVIEFLIINVLEKRKKHKQLLSGSTTSARFERILLSVGTEPTWLRLLTGGSVTSPNLSSLVPN